MNTFIIRIFTTSFFALFVTIAYAESDTLKPALVSPDEMTWGDSSTGVKLARIVGDYKKPGMYAVRVKYPAGYRDEPHFHKDERIVVVLSGTVYVGYGEHFDETKMKALPAGSVWTEPAKQPHFMWAKKGEVVIQVIGNGPSDYTPVEPE